MQIDKRMLAESLYEIDAAEVAHFPPEEHEGWDDYGKGLIVGTIDTLMACGLEFAEACDIVKSCFAERVRRGAIPPIWYEIFADYIAEPPIPELIEVIKFLVDQDCEIEYPNGREVLFRTPNALEACVKITTDGKYVETIDGDVTEFDTLGELKLAWL